MKDKKTTISTQFSVSSQQQLLAGLFGAVFLLCNGPAFAQGGPPGRRPTIVESVTVQPALLRSSVKAVGTILADAAAILRAELPGQILRLHFEDGQQVQKGAALFTIEATVLEAEVNEARANVEQSEAAYNRAKELIEDKLISATDFDTARANYNVGVARLLSSEARLSKAIIRAPFAGTVGLRRTNVGDYATIGQELVDVVRLDPLRVDFSVPETLLAQIQPGQTIRVSVGAYAGEFFTGTITAIAPQIDVSGHSVTIRARLPNEDLKLRPGLFAQISITLQVKTDALMIPEEAVWPIGQTKTVYVVQDSKAVQKTVLIGQRQDGMAEIVNGLSPGDEVVTAGHLKIFDGADVKTIPSSRLSEK
jgi:membrane fusion protein (multidrug efflux system)